MSPAATKALVAALLVTVLSSPGDGVPWRRRPAPISEVGDALTRAPCRLLPYEQRHGMQYTEAPLEVAPGGPDALLGVLHPGNYSYSGSYRQPDPCRYD